MAVPAAAVAIAVVVVAAFFASVILVAATQRTSFDIKGDLGACGNVKAFLFLPLP